MRNDTRLKFNAYVERVAALNGVGDATKTFAVDPSIEQKLEDKVREEATFLGEINIFPRDELKGEKIGMDTSGPIASRTDTSGGTKRQTRDITTLDSQGYECAKTNFDTHISYAKMDLWAKFSDFQARMANQVVRQIARDRQMIGWNGESIAANTDLDANPLLQDVNKGWLQHLREDKPDNVLSGIKVGPGGDYANLDALVFDMASSLLAPWYRKDLAIRPIVSWDLLTGRAVGLLDQADTPTERAAVQQMLDNKSVGGRAPRSESFFPDRTVFLCDPKALSIYWQQGSRRRHIKEAPELDRVEDYQSVNEAYVNEDNDGLALVEGILLPDGLGGWA
jgi:P2 family phage major capsid protein